MSFPKKEAKIVVSGYYGFDNCGDEAVLLAMIHCLRKLKPGVRIVVLSDKPEKTRALYDVKAVNRWNPAMVAKELLTCRLFISGGGSLLQDVTSVKSPRYYLAVILAASFLAKRTAIYGQGVGPLAEKKNRLWTAKVLSRCSAIMVRDSASAQLLHDLGLSGELQVACDPVMALSYADIDRKEISGHLREMNILDNMGRKRKPLLLVMLRCWQDNAHLAAVAELLDAQARIGWDILLAPAQFPADMEAIDVVGNLMKERLYCLGVGLSAHQFLALASYADKVFSMRLHGLIAAMAMGVPMVGLSYDPKVDAFMEQAGLARYCLPYAEFDWETAEYLLEEIETLPMESLQAMEDTRKSMQELAWGMAQRAIDMLE